jgi:hypothetical protein
MNWWRALFQRLSEWIVPDRVSCPICLGTGCVDCEYRGDFSTQGDGT